MITEKTGQPGDLKTLDVTIDDVSIINAVSNLTIFQEIQSPFWTCEIRVVDFNNRITLVPIRPGGTIKVKLKTEQPSETDGERVFIFIQTGIPQRDMKNHQHIEYTIQGVSADMVKNINTRICECYRGKPTNLHAKFMVEKYIGGEVKTDPPSDFVVNGTVGMLSPFTFAMQMAKASYNSNTADYLFFQKDEHLWWLRRMETMYNEGPVLTVKVRPAQVRDEAGNLSEDYNTMLTSYFFMHYNVLENMLGGLYASRAVQFDFVSKIWSSKSFKYGNDCGEDGAKKPWTNNSLETPSNNIFFYPADDKVWEGKHIHDYAKQWGPTRKSSLMKLLQDRIYLQLPGGVKAWEYLGQRVDIELPSEQDWCDDLIYDPQLTGHYLVTAVAHDIGQGSYGCKVELIKKRHAEKMEKPCEGYKGDQ